MESRLRRKKKKNWIKIVSGIIGLLIILIGGYAVYLYNSVANTAGDMHESLEREKSDKRDGLVDLNKKQPVSILIMGVDERPGDRGRSDTLIVTTLNPKKESMYMFSIPRDTRTDIIGKGKVDKINHAYAFGGTDMSIATVENFLGIPIDFFVKVNMEAFKDIVDAVGGITVNNDLAWTDDRYYKKGYVYEKGEINLNGAQALGYVRMRFQDPKGDLGRNERQQKVVKAVIDEAASFSTITKVDEILGTLGTNVKTNLTFDQMKLIQRNYIASRKNMESFELKGTTQTINGVSYYIIPDEERNVISARLKEHLEIN